MKDIEIIRGALESLRLHAIENGCSELLVNNLCDEISRYIRPNPEAIDGLKEALDASTIINLEYKEC